MAKLGTFISFATPPMSTSTSSSHTYSPAVPLSVYRELAAELQATRAMLDSLNAQNQQLVKHNQQLRQEVEKAVQSVLYLQQVVDSTTVSTVTTPSAFPSAATGSIRLENVLTVEEEGRYRYRSPAASVVEVNGWKLAIAILLVMLTAFGIGYLAIRPLLSQR